MLAKQQRQQYQNQLTELIKSDKIQADLHDLFPSDDQNDEPASNHNAIVSEASAFQGNNRNPRSPRSILKAAKLQNPNIHLPLPEEQIIHLLRLSQARNSRGEYLIHKYNNSFILRLLDKKSFLKLERSFKKFSRLDCVITLTDFVWSFLSAIWNKLKIVSRNISQSEVAGESSSSSTAIGRDCHPQLYVTNSLIQICSRLLHVRKNIRWKDLTNFMIEQMSDADNIFGNKTTMLDAALEVKNVAKTGYSQMIRKLDLDLPVIYGTVQHRKKRIEKNNRGRDTRKHNNGIKKLSYSAQMSSIFCLDNNVNQLMLYDSFSLRIKAHIALSNNHFEQAKIIDFALSDQEKQIAACIDDYTIGIWSKSDDFKTQRVIRFSSHVPLQTKIWFIQQAGKWMTFGKQNRLKFWDMIKDQPISLNPPLKEKILDLQEIRSINALAVATLDKTISIWCLKKYELRFIVKSPYQRHIHKLAYSQIFQKLFTAGYSGVIDVWRFDNQKECTHTSRISGHNSPIITLELIQDLLLTIDEQAILKSWNVKTMECLQSHTFQQNLKVIGIQQLSMASFCVYGSRIVLFNCKLVEIAKDGTGMSDIKIPQNKKQESKERSQERPPSKNRLAFNTRDILSKIGKTALKTIQQNKSPTMKEKNNSLEIVDVTYNWVTNQLVIATRSDVRLMSLTDGRQKKIFTFLLRYLQEITSFSVDAHLRKFFVGGHYGALKCFTYNNATVLKEFPLITGQVSYLNIDFKNQLLITASFDQNFLQIQRIPSDQGTFQSLRHLKNPAGQQEVLKVDINIANNAIMIVCVEAALFYHYQTLQFKGFCDTLFLQDQSKRYNKTGTSSLNFTIDSRFDCESQFNGKKKSMKHLMVYQIRNAIFLGDYQLVAVVCNHKQNQNDCHTIIYHIHLEQKQIQRFQPVIRINHQSNPYFEDMMKQENRIFSNTAVNHLSFKLFERVPPNAPRSITALGNYPKNKVVSASSSTSDLLDTQNNIFSHPQFRKNKPTKQRKIQSLLVFGKANGLVQLFDLSQLLKQYNFAKLKRTRQPYRQANQSGLKFLNEESIFDTEAYMNAQFLTQDIQLREQNFSSQSFVREWPAHHQGRISMLKLEEVQNQRLIISASEDGFIKLWSKSGRLLACSNINQLLPSVWNFKFNTKKKRVCSMYKAKLVYDSVVKKYTEIAGTKLKQSDKLRPALSSNVLHSPQKGEQQKMESIAQIEEEEHLILKDAIQRYIQMKKAEENKICREQNDLDIKLLRQQLGLTHASSASMINKSSQDMDLSNFGGAFNNTNQSLGMTLNSKLKRENHFIQNLDVMIFKSKKMDGNVHEKLEEYKTARENILEFEQSIERVKSIDVIKELSESKRKNKGKWLSDNLVKLIKNKWNRSEKEEFKNILKVTTRKYFLKKAQQEKKRSKSSNMCQSSCKIVKKIDDSKVSANKTELIKYARAKNAAIGNEIDLAKNTLPDGRPNSLYKFQMQLLKQQQKEDSSHSLLYQDSHKLPQPKIRDLLALMNSTVRKYKSQRVDQNATGDDIPMLHLLNISQPEQAQKYLNSQQKRQLKESIQYSNLKFENQLPNPIIQSARDQSTFITQTQKIQKSARTSKSLSRQCSLGGVRTIKKDSRWQSSSDLNQAFGCQWSEGEEDNNFEFNIGKALVSQEQFKRSDKKKKKQVHIKPTFLNTQRKIASFRKNKKNFTSYDLTDNSQITSTVASNSRQFVSRNMQGTLGTLPSIFEDNKDRSKIAGSSFTFQIPETKKVNQSKLRQFILDDLNKLL